MIKENLIEQIKRQIKHLSFRLSLTKTDIQKIEQALREYNLGNKIECNLIIKSILNFEILLKESSTFREIFNKSNIWIQHNSILKTLETI